MTVEPTEDDETNEPETRSTQALWFTTAAEQEAIQRCKRQEKRDDRKHQTRDTTNWLDAKASEQADTPRTTSTNEKPRMYRDEREEYREKWISHRTMISLIKLYEQDEEDPLTASKVHHFVESECRIMKLTADLAHLKELAGYTDEQAVELHTVNPETSQEAGESIDRGTNTILRNTDPFVPSRIQEILSQVEIGKDLSIPQRERVRALLTEFADVFALSLSEVRTVDWYKHHLNIDPNIPLPQRAGQRPVAGPQKDWLYSMLDNMEGAHIIKKVSGDFIKALSSTNLQPKDSGKTGAT